MNKPHRWDKYFGTLWRHRDFRTLWISLTITHFGGQITFLALPLTAAVLLHATPGEMGVLMAMEVLPYTLFGLFTGVLVDRSQKLPLIIRSDLGRGFALLAVPVAAWCGVLCMPVLYIVGFLVGIGGIVGWAAYQVFMAERVGNQHLVEANSRIALSDSASQLLGPGLAGLVIQLLSAPFAILVDAISFFISAFMLRSIKPEASVLQSRPSELVPLSKNLHGIWTDAKEGLGLIWRMPVLKAIAISLCLWNILRHIYLAVLILFATRELNLSAGSIGAAFIMGGVGVLMASACCQWLNRRWGIGRVMLIGLTVPGFAWLLVAAISVKHQPALFLGLVLFFLDLGVMLFFINYLTLRQAITPPHFRGRVTSTMIFLSVSLAPVGSLLGGAMGSWIGLRSTIALAGIGGILLGVTQLFLSPLQKMHVLPETDTPTLSEQAVTSI